MSKNIEKSINNFAEESIDTENLKTSMEKKHTIPS
jgi:hypothetical protein